MGAQDPSWKVIRGDCVEVMATFEDESVDAVIADPPYGIGFMGHEWDQPGAEGKKNGTPGRAFRKGVPDGQRRVANPKPSGIDRDGLAMAAGRYDQSLTAHHAFQAWCEVWCREALRVLKPGGHIAAFGGPRTSHRLACAVEDAGFEIRDSLMWLFGAGFPKSLDVSKAIDKAAGVEREVAGISPNWRESKRDREQYGSMEVRGENAGRVTFPVTSEAERWQGWGTALKPAYEPIVLGRKPLRVRNVSANVLAHGTGALNIDGCRIAGANPSEDRRESARRSGNAPGRPGEYRDTLEDRTSPERYMEARAGEQLGRWPANVILSHSEDCVLVGTREVRNEGGSLNGAGPRENTVYNAHRAPRGDWRAYGEGGVETVEVWACVPDCPVRMLDDQAGTLASGNHPAVRRGIGFTESAGGQNSGTVGERRATEAGGPSRFFYCSKTSRAERNAGLEGFPVAHSARWSSGTQSPGTFQSERSQALARGVCPRCETPLAWADEDRAALIPADLAAPPQRDTTAPTTPQAADCDSSTSSSGKPPMEPSRTDLRSTTRTETSRTTRSPTSNSSLASTTSESTPNASAEPKTGVGNAGAASAKNGSPPPSSTSTSPERDGSPTADADPAMSGPSSEPSSSAALACPSCGEVIEGALRNSHPT